MIAQAEARGCLASCRCDSEGLVCRRFRESKFVSLWLVDRVLVR